MNSAPAGNRTSKYSGSVDSLAPLPLIGPTVAEAFSPSVPAITFTSAARQLYQWDVAGRNVPVGCRFHLFLRRQVEPKLKAAHPPLALLRHFRVNDATCRSHPLHVDRTEVT